ncbi:Uncharacterised protein [Bordetella pertussis]|nr:Uncharacterised protein [Bordetella pertussis]CFP62543.1 Uncharacterised protein [Bordetella pertussis]
MTRWTLSGMTTLMKAVAWSAISSVSIRISPISGEK